MGDHVWSPPTMGHVNHDHTFRADNIGSLLRPSELIEARTARREGRIDAERLREIEDGSILTALELQKEAGVVGTTLATYCL